MTLEDWIKEGTDGTIACAMEDARLQVDEVVRGKRRIAYLSGPPGCGKTHLLNGAADRWRAQGLEPLRPSLADGMFGIFRQAGGKRPVLIDDSDTLFSSILMLNQMKNATDPNSTGRLEHTTKIKGKTTMVSTKVPLLLATNHDLSDIRRTFPKDLASHVEALFDRQPPIIIPHDADELARYVLWLGISTDLIRFAPTGGGRISMNARAAALEWFEANQKRMNTVSARPLKDAASLFHRNLLSTDHTEYLNDAIRDYRLGHWLKPGPQLRSKTDWLSVIREWGERQRLAKAA
jgi:hypothetical protein